MKEENGQLRKILHYGLLPVQLATLPERKIVPCSVS
jgi:hypothetical protein